MIFSLPPSPLALAVHIYQQRNRSFTQCLSIIYNNLGGMQIKDSLFCCQLIYPYNKLSHAYTFIMVTSFFSVMSLTCRSFYPCSVRTRISGRERLRTSNCGRFGMHFHT